MDRLISKVGTHQTMPEWADSPQIAEFDSWLWHLLIAWP